MIISVSRRTDIPAFYVEWLINRLRAGYCVVANPFDPRRVSCISLMPEDVEVIVFWTRNPRPLFPYLDELEARGYRYYFQYTLMDNPRPIDPQTPSLSAALETFQELSRRIGKERVIWRYDPIVFTTLTPPSFHRQAYQRIASALRGYTCRSVVSLLDVYPKIRKRLAELEKRGIALIDCDGTQDWFEELMGDLVDIARAYSMEIVSCAEELDLRRFGIQPGKCIDDEYIQRVFGIQVTHTKDPGQRRACGCVISKDIGAYDTCIYGCQYCYATGSFRRARQNFALHDPNSPSLLGWHDLPSTP